MKNNSFYKCLFLLLIFSLLFYSCAKEKAPGKDRVNSFARNITIINKTESEIKGYLVSTASGAEITKGSTNKDSFTIEIHKNFNNDSEIEVVLFDRYERLYVKTQSVPLRGNTDITILPSDRKAEGVIKDKWKDLTAWFNEYK